MRSVDAAIGAGVNLIDCADICFGGESERFLGEAFKRNGMRSEVLIASIDPLVIPAKAGIQYLQGLFWIPALRSAAAGMTSLVAGLITTNN